MITTTTPTMPDATVRSLGRHVADKMDDGTETIAGKSLAKVPRVPYFSEERDYMDSYLGRPEHFAKSKKWNRAHWAMYLSVLLKGQALVVFSMMPADPANDHDKLKDDALLKWYLLSADGFKRQFHPTKPETGDSNFRETSLWRQLPFVKYFC